MKVFDAYRVCRSADPASLFRARSRTAASRQYAATRVRSATECIRAASTSVGSAPVKAPGSASCAVASTRADESDTSPSSTAARVTGISSSAFAIRTCSRATPHATLNADTNHDAADRCPSRSNSLRRSISASLRNRSTSSCSTARCSSAKSSSMRASGNSASDSDRNTSLIERSSLMSSCDR